MKYKKTRTMTILGIIAVAAIIGLAISACGGGGDPPSCTHTFSNYVSNDNGTCIADGTETATCEKNGCNETHTRPKANSKKPDNHAPGEDATCTTGKICTDCEEELEPALVCTPGWVTIVEPTYFTEGSENGSCTYCDPTGGTRPLARVPVIWTAISAGSTAGQSTFSASTNVRNITWGSDKFVAVGQSGRMAYSTDGITWTAISAGAGQSTFANNMPINGIAYGTAFVAVGGNGGIATSNNGTTWTSRTSTFNTYYNDINGIAWNGTTYVAVGENGRMAYSTGGVSWTAIEPGSGAGQSTFPDLSTGTINGIIWGTICLLPWGIAPIWQLPLTE
jgi:hypothetical protein